MLHVRNLFYFIFLHFIVATPQLNLYFTDGVNQSENDSNHAFQHNCFRITLETTGLTIERRRILYCMSELPSNSSLENNNLFPKFTFGELAKRNITNEKLYLWSIPIDIIERYQFYLNQLSSSSSSYDLSLAEEIVYNCTLPRFGHMCQYELPYYYSYHSSLYEIIRDFYSKYISKATSFTCYIHLQCNRGPSPACLDWSEICDGKVDCLDGGLDEEHCWQLEINQCKDNEYRCMNGQCIPRIFFREEYPDINCIDASDRMRQFPEYYKYTCYMYEPAFGCDDIKCNYTHLTSTCVPDRTNLLLNAMFSIKDNSVSEECWLALKCIFNVPHSEQSSCDEFCEEDACIKIIKNECSNMLYFPNVPIFFGHIYFAFKKTDSEYPTIEDIGLLYICYNKSHYDPLFDMASKILFNNATCFLHKTVSYPSNWSSLWYIMPDTSLGKLYDELKKYQLVFNYSSTFCTRLNMYQCNNSSKCISIHRLNDTVYDCPYMDDENITEINDINIIEQFKHSHYKCQKSKKYIHQALVRNNLCDCEEAELDLCEDEILDSFDYSKDILFQNICDGFVELKPIVIDGKNQTDETECEYWQCNNHYTHCDEVWNCLNGADELGCPSLIPFNCSPNHHLCVSPYTNQLMCLSIDKANDGHIDCLGAHDEPILCRTELPLVNSHNFHCMNQTSQSCVADSNLCNGFKDCMHGDDEQFCTTNRTVFSGHGLCMTLPLTQVEYLLCQYTFRTQNLRVDPFAVHERSLAVKHTVKDVKNSIYSSSSAIKTSTGYETRCHLGVDLRVWSNNITKNTCLCPPSYYGDQCQYQNQRVSLTIQFRALSDWQIFFSIIISLIDDSDERIIHSYEQINFLSKRDCKRRFDMYLIYSNRPKDSTKNYSIHIDFYEKDSLNYRGSLLFPIDFPFLPVHRLSLIVDIPQIYDQAKFCSNNDQCIHGKCIKYSNNSENLTFCQCEPGWSGRYCTIQHTCTCGPNSLCIGVSANNRSICVCSRYKFGPRCLLTNTICQINNNSTCLNGGQCIPDTDFELTYQKIICICPEGYSGNQCEIVDNQLILTFDKDIVLSQSIFIHFIYVDEYFVMFRTTTFKTIPVRKDSVTIYWKKPFQLVFIEFLHKTYYLSIFSGRSNHSTIINQMIKSSDRCLNINELFNDTFLRLHFLRRIKYYHLPCQNQSLNLSCFYDEVHLCLCENFGEKRLANCLKFDHNMTFNCEGRNECKNGAQCFQDDPTCPTRSTCMCQPCFYGKLCQFRTNGFGLSLDAIIGYHILPGISIIQQSSIIQFSLALTIIFIITGFIDSVLCIITFKNKTICQVGCGLYLLSSSITNLFTTIIFGFKFWIVLLAQMATISNRSFLLFQCISFDVLLRICLNMGQWLNAFVALERAIATVKATRFNKKKSKKTAKFVIIILFLIITLTSIHDPISRYLIDEINDANEKRTWCVITYPLELQIFNSIMHILHIIGPFILNLASTGILITQKSRQKSHVHTHRNYQEILREQLRQHKHLLTAPVALIILTLPRLLIAFVSKCMKSADDVWLFLCGYFISFIPPMLTFIIFVLPSKLYKKEFQKTIQQHLTTVQRRLHLK